MGMRNSGRAKVLFAAVGVTLAQIASADPVGFGVDLSIGTSDNITRASSAGQSETIAAAGVNLSVLREGSRLDADIKGDVRYVDYLQNTYDGEVIGRLDGVLTIAVVPQHFDWAVQENFGQVRVDPFAPVTPTNRENVNYVSTGPDFSVRLGSSGFAKLSGRFSRMNYEISDFDSKRLFGGLALGRELSPAASVSLNVNTERFRFDDTLVNTDYDRRSAYLHYEAKGIRTQLGTNFGYSDTGNGAGSINGLLAQLMLTRTLSPSMTLRFEGGSQLTDAGDSFRNQPAGAIGGIETGPVSATTQSFKRRYVFVRTTIDVTVTWAKDAYDGNPSLDVARSSAELKVERRVTRALTGGIFGGWSRSNYDNIGLDDRDWNGGAELRLAVGAATSVALQYDHFKRSDSALVEGYDENRAFLTVGYRVR